MQYDRYYYSVLGDREKEVYKLIYKGIEQLDGTISVPTRFFVNVDLADIIQKILLDNPHIFYVDRNGYTTTTTLFNVSVRFNYLYTATEIAELRVKINNVVNAMLKRVKGSTDYEKEKSVHDLICGNVEYSYETLDNFKKYSSVSNTILGVLFYKTAVCEGIALTFKLLLNMLDIKCIVAMGKLEGEFHAWNVVKIDGQSYHVDVTQDLSVAKGVISYDYFNLTDEDVSKTHAFFYKFPVCNSDKYNYFVHENLIARTKSDIEKIVRDSSNNNKNYVTFKFMGNTSLKNACKYAVSVLGLRTASFIENSNNNTVLILFSSPINSAVSKTIQHKKNSKPSKNPLKPMRLSANARKNGTKKTKGLGFISKIKDLFRKK